MGNTGPTGQKGDRGEPAPPSISKGNGIGQPNVTADVMKMIATSDIGKYASYTQMSILLHQAELDYLNKKFPEAASRFYWLFAISSGNAGVNGLPDKYFGKLGQRLNFGNLPSWEQLHNRVVLLKNQMEAGLNYFGLPENFVPLIKVKEYEDRFKPIFDAATDVETSFKEYTAAQLQQRDVKNEFETYAGNAQDFIDSLKHELEQLSSTADHLQDDVATLWTVLESLRGQLDQAQNDFKQAVANQANGCSFSNIIRLASSIISISASTLGAFNAIKDGITNAKSALDTIGSNNITLLNLKSDAAKKARDNLLDNITHLQNDGASLQKAATTLQSAFQSANNSEEAADKIKYTMDEDEFDKQIEPYLNLAQAQVYKELVHKFIETSKTRNQKILDYTAAVIQEQMLLVKMKQKTEELQSAKDKLARSEDWLLADRDTIVQTALREVKDGLLRQLFMANRALDYSSLELNDFQYNDTTIADLKKSWADIVLRELDIYEKRNVASLTFPHDQTQKGFTVTLHAADDPIGFKQFIQTGRLIFRIQPGVNDLPFSPKGLGSVRVGDVAVNVKGIKSADGEISLLLTHHGNASFLTPDRKIVRYSHPSRTLRQVYTIEPYQVITGTNLAEVETAYADLSLYAIWTLDVSKGFNQGLDLTSVDSVELSFRGTFLPCL